MKKEDEENKKTKSFELKKAGMKMPTSLKQENPQNMKKEMSNPHKTHEHEGMEMGMKMDMPQQAAMQAGAMEGAMHSMHKGEFKKRFFVSLLISIPIILFVPMMGVSLPFQFTFPGSDWIVFVCASILFVYGGKPFLEGARMELKMKSPAMMTLISLGITVSYFYSVYGFFSTTIFHSTTHTMNFFWEFATLILVMLLGHWIEMNAVMKAGDALQKMASLLPTMAHLVKMDGSVTDVPLEKVQEKNFVLVKAGEAIPTDGLIVEGETTVNESLVTGEVKSISKTINDKVIGGAINGSGTIKVRVSATGEAGYLAQVMKLVDAAQKDKSKIETVSEKVAKWLFYIALFVGLITFFAWLLIDKNLSTALSRMVTVLIIACPHALGLAIPLVVARSTSLGAARGLLIRNREALERANEIDTVLMDKTGTLTGGKFAVAQLKSFTKDANENQILAWLAALENYSNHPLSVGILNAAEGKHIRIPIAQKVLNKKGVGLSGTIEGKSFEIVTAAYLDKNHIAYDKEIYRSATDKAYSVSFLLKEKEVVGMVALGDKVRPEAKKLIEALRTQQLNAVMLTGDNQSAAEAVADELGIKEFQAALLPNEKAEIVAEYQQKNKKVMMVGDGINDAPSLARADIGVAIGAGTDVAIDSADVILVNSNPADILVFLDLSKRTMKKMIQNIWWGAGYNIFAIPLAAGVLAPLGIVLSPAVGALLMSLSTIIVALNAMSLNLKKN